MNPLHAGETEALKKIAEPLRLSPIAFAAHLVGRADPSQHAELLRKFHERHDRIAHAQPARRTA